MPRERSPYPARRAIEISVNRHRTHSPLATLLAIAASASAEEPLAKFTAPAPNSPAEPLAKQMSVAKAVDFIDRASLHWQRSRKCVTCHTNGAYLMARAQ